MAFDKPKQVTKGTARPASGPAAPQCAQCAVSNREGLPEITEADVQAMEAVIEQLYKNKSDKLRLCKECAVLRTALEESVRLQAHYAELLNMHDGGKRIAFKTVDEWLARLKQTGRI